MFLKNINKLIVWLSRTNIFLYSISLWGISFCTRGTIRIVQYIFNIPDIEFHEKLTNQNFEVNLDLLFNTLLFAPIFETLIFQTFFFLAFKYLRINKTIIIILSASVFSVIHDYSLIYMIDTAFIGAMFMYGYMLRAKADKKPFLSTAVAHGTINLTAIIATLITHFYKFGTFF